ncbi:MAG: PH domain-containing protein [Pyrinomonadaceae bacterium]
MRYDDWKNMYCIKCGATNSNEAVYCQKCGNLLESEDDTRVVQKTKPSKFTVENDEEAQIFSIRPTLMFVKLGYVAAIIGAFLLVGLIALFSNLFDSSVSGFIVVLLGLSLLLIPAFFHLKNKIIKYTLTDSKVEVDKGLVSHTTRNIPLRTIQDVTVSATAMQRLLGFGNIVIENANEVDEKITLHNINSPKKYADILLKQMRLLDK